MKKLLVFIMTLFAVIACERDSDTISVGRISFTFDNSKLSSGGRNSGETVPAFVLLSIETSTGTPVETDKKIQLIAFGSGYVSENIELPIGNFKLTKFIILNSDNKAIFATPVAGSSLSSLVGKPLPIEFSISPNGTTQVVPEVLPVNQDNTPSMFGYVEFGFKVVGYSPVKSIQFTEEYGFINNVEIHYSSFGIPTELEWEGYGLPPPASSHFVYTETRTYNNGLLTSVIGSGNMWDIKNSYDNNNRLLKKVVNRDIGWTGTLKYDQTVEFLQYTASLPAKLKISTNSTTRFSEFQFTTGDLTNIIIKNEDESIDKEIDATYSTDINPLAGLLETGLFNYYGFHNNNIFYYSRHFPKSITKKRKLGDQDWDYFETTEVKYSIEKDALGRVTEITATVKINDNLGHNFLDAPAYKISIGY
jgi:hypothetical protein